MLGICREISFGVSYLRVVIRGVSCIFLERGFVSPISHFQGVAPCAVLVSSRQ